LQRSWMSAVALLTSVSVCGCSFIFTDGPPPNHERLPAFSCSTSYAPPVLDTVWAGLNGFGMATAAGKSDEEWKASGNKYDRSTVIGVGLLWLVVSGASAIYGYQKVASCTDAREKLAQRQSRTPRAWPRYPAYPPGGYPPPTGYPPGYEPPPITPAPPAPGQPPTTAPGQPPTTAPGQPPTTAPQSPATGPQPPHAPTDSPTPSVDP
jgi:hypothetical protein